MVTSPLRTIGPFQMQLSCAYKVAPAAMVSDSLVMAVLYSNRVPWLPTNVPALVVPKPVGVCTESMMLSMISGPVKLLLPSINAKAPDGALLVNRSEERRVGK